MKNKEWKIYADLTWYQKFLAFFESGCEGCTYSDREHHMAKSFVHENPPPKSERPTQRVQHSNGSI